MENLAPALSRVPSRPNWLLATLLMLSLLMASGLAQAKTAPESFADLAAQLLPSVVNISTTQVIEGRSGMELPKLPPGSPFEDFFKDFFDRNQPQGRSRKATSLGSGFIIRDGNYVVTNNHVIQDADEITVILHDNTRLKAELVGRDPKTDLAVLKVKSKNGKLTAVKFGDSTVARVGDWIMAIGNPFGLGGTVTAGIISARGRDINSGPYDDFIQTDASINRGNSGGPTFDLNGNVIGVNTAIFSPTGGSVGIGFAIPAELASEVTKSLIKDGKVSRGWLGVAIQDLTDDMAEAQGIKDAKGAIIADVTNGSPAEKGGLARGDIILSVNGDKVTDATSTTRLVGKLIANTQNKFEIIRGGKKQTLNVTVGERPSNPNAIVEPALSSSATTAPDTGKEVKEVGATFEKMDDELRTRLGLREGENGLLVSGITKDGVMEEAGIQEGMVILEVNNKPATSVEAFRKAITDAKNAKRTKILIAVRIGQITNYRTIDLSDAE